MIILSVAFLIINSPTFSGVQFSSEFNWFTIKTNHFVIHFPALGVPDQARMEFVDQVAGLAEEIWETFQRSGVTVPAPPVHIVLADYYDYYNGYATPFPDNTIVLLPFPPLKDRANDDHWLRTLILHELSHICQMDQSQGFFRFWNRVMGRVVLPNALMPAWLLEGYAVYNETRFSNMGRLRSREWWSLILNSVSASGFPNPDQCNGYELQRYPAGLTPYLYGSSVIQYWAGHLRKGVWDDYNYTKSFYPPFFEEVAFKKVFGKSSSALWKEWRDWVTQSSDSVRKYVNQKNLTKIRRITYEGYQTAAPIWSPSGNRIYYISANGREETSIKELTLGTMATRILYRGQILGNLTISPDGKYFAFAELRTKGDGYQQSDIFLYDLQLRRVKRLTKGERAVNPDFAPDNAHIAYVSNRDGVSRLRVLNYLTGADKTIAELGHPDYYREPRFSPGGNLIAVSVWRTGGYADIEILDLKNGWVIPVTNDRANDIDPCWSRTGKFLFFISDRNGIYNLYAYGVESRKLFKCTNVFSGVFEPAVSPDERKIGFVMLTPEGYDVGLMGFRPQEWQEAEEYFDNYPNIEYEQVSPSISPIYYYSPFPTVLPKFWLPWVNVGADYESGIFTIGWDVLQFHRYRGFAGYRFREKSPVLALGYEFHRYYPVLEFSGELTLNRQQSRVGVSLPVYGSRYRQNSGLGMMFLHEENTSLSFDGFYQFSNARMFRFNVAPVQGRSLGIVTDARLKSVLASQDLLRLVGFWNEYLGAPPANWSISFRLVLATAFGDSSRRSAFQITDRPGILMVRGLGDSGLMGINSFISGLEFRFPVLWVERGWGLMPIFLKDINAALFSEGVIVSDDFSRTIRAWDAGIGMEFCADLLVAHYVPFNISAGLVFGVKRIKQPQIYLRAGSELLKGILSASYKGLNLNSDKPLSIP